jgi:hypothetical protein
MRLGDCTEEIQLGFPYYTLEPLVTRGGRYLDPEAAAVAVAAVASQGR